MAAPEKVSLRKADFSDEVLIGRTFEGEDLTRANFRRATLRDCTFKSCDLGCADFLNARIERSSFIDCKLEKPEVRGVVTIDCALEVYDGRHGELGYTAFLMPDGLHIGCALFSWSMARGMTQRDLLKMDKRNAVNWWRIHGPKLLEIGEARKWV